MTDKNNSILASWFLTCEEFFFHGCKPNLLIAGTKIAVNSKEEINERFSGGW